ncbi:SPOSA6832_00831, partial [Sporobolomyces salmonicolor]
MFAVTGTGFSALKRAVNDGKPVRHTLDTWEENMMERDRRLTGSLRGQSTEPIAPKTFATNSIWQTEKVERAFL